jgi:hypothetical protein
MSYILISMGPGLDWSLALTDLTLGASFFEGGDDVTELALRVTCFDASGCYLLYIELAPPYLSSLS